MGKDQPSKYSINHFGAKLECDRVTGILAATKASAGLATWYGKEERKAFKTLVDLTLDLPSLKEVVSDLPIDDDDLFASRIRDESAANGTGIHKLVELDATGNKLPDTEVITPEQWQRYKYWEDFRKSEGITYVDAEKRVYSPNLLVAGTLDLTFNWKGTFWMGDTKTGTLRRDAAVQIVTYYMLREETLAIERGDEQTIQAFNEAYSTGRLPGIKWPRMCVLAIGEDKLEIYELDRSLGDTLARNFLYRLQIYRDDQTIRPFKRIHPIKVLKDGTIKDAMWLRAS